MPNTASGTAQAKDWCTQARKILKKSWISKNERSRFREANQEITKLLAKLAINQTAHDKCELRYLKIAGKAKLAVDINDQNAVKNASQELNKLVADYQNLLASLAKFDAAYAKLKIELAEAKGLRGAFTPGSLVKDALDNALSRLDQARVDRDVALSTVSESDLQTATASLVGVKDDLKTANEEAKKAQQGAKQYLEAMKKWGELQPLVRAALQELRTLPGAEVKADDLQKLFNDATALIKDQNGMWTGHDQAVTMLSGYQQIVQDARTESAILMASDQPQNVVDAYNDAIKEVNRHGDLAPPYATAGYRDDAIRLAESGRRDASTVVQDLGKLTVAVKAEADRLQIEKQHAEVAVKDFDKAVDALVTLDVPASIYVDSQRIGEMSKQSDVADRQWSAATARLTSATQELMAIDAAYQQHGKAWEAKRTELQSIRASAGALVVIPAFALDANRIRETADELLMQFESYDFAACNAAFDNTTVGTPPKTLSQACQDLQARAKATGAPDDRQVFLNALNAATAEINEAVQSTRATLCGHVDKMKRLAPRTHDLLIDYWNQRVSESEKAWDDCRKSAKGNVKQVDDDCKAAIKAFADLLGEQQNLTDTDLSKLLTRLGNESSAQLSEKTKKWIQRGIDELTELRVDASTEQKSLDDLVKNPPGDLEGLEDRMDQKLKDARRVHAEKHEQAKHDLRETVWWPVKNLPISETYRAELEKDVLDVQALFDSKDPYLFDIAHKMQQDLEKHIDEINLNPKLYQTNKDRMDKLATQIGLLIPNLPETHRRLKTALTEQMVESKHCDPSEMSQRLDELRDHVQNALFSKLPDRAKEIEDYRKRKAEVQAKFKEMKEKTHTRVTEKSDAFETFYEARLVEASGHKSREGGVPEALAVLKNLDDMLQKVLDAENPRAQLRELDAEQQRDQQLMKDMAAQFERELGVFRSTMLKEAKAVAKKSEDGDTDLIKSLLGVANAAEKIVSPYLKNNATLPHQKAGANPSPDMKRMQHDFERARGMLAEATRTAQRLIQTPTSTNVKGPQQNGLRKILKKWHERTQAYGAAVREVAGAIRAAAANETDPQILQNAEDAARVVEGMANQFRGEAFASSFADLMKPMPKDKREREKAERAELAAREAALRIMRQFRTDLLKNPLLTKLTDKKTNPFEAATMMAAAGGLRALLKEIELQVLNSV